MKKLMIIIFAIFFTLFIFTNENILQKELKLKSLKFCLISNDFIKNYIDQYENKLNLNINLKKYKLFKNLGIGFIIPGGILTLISGPMLTVFHSYSIFNNKHFLFKDEYNGSFSYYLYLSSIITIFTLGGIFDILAIVSFIFCSKHFKKSKKLIKKTSMNFNYNFINKNIFLSFVYKL